MTMDQVAAEKIGQDTPLPSLELSIEDVSLSCGAGLACAYMNTISWKTATTPLPMENNPQVVFERLFGDGRNNAERNPRREQSSSILDSVQEEVPSLRKELPASDRSRLNEYLADVREIERRIEKAAAAGRTDLEIPDAPAGIPAFRRTREADVRPAGARVQGRNHARLDPDVRAGNQHHGLSGSGIREAFHNPSHHSERAAKTRTVSPRSTRIT